MCVHKGYSQSQTVCCGQCWCFCSGRVFTISLQSGKYTSDELDLLAIYFTLVKNLFIIGALDKLPPLLALINPLRLGEELHLTTIRNEQVALVHKCESPRASDEGLSTAQQSAWFASAERLKVRCPARGCALLRWVFLLPVHVCSLSFS